MRIKSVLVFLITFLCIGPRLIAQESQPVVMNLDECLNYAFEHNETLLNADLEQDKQKAYVGEIMADGLPQLNASADFKKNLKVRTTFIPATFFDPSAGPEEKIGVQFGTPYEGDFGLNATQMIFNGSYFVGLKAAQTLKDLTNKDFIKTKIDVAEAVSKAYYSVLVSEEGYRLVQNNYNRLDSLLRETQVMYDNGFVERIDLNRTQVEFNNAATNLTNQERLVEYSKQLLKFQMGMPLETDLEIAEKPSDLKINYVTTLEEDIEYKRRIEYKQLTIRDHLANLDLKNNHVQYLPEIDLYFGIGMNSGTDNTGDLFSIGGSAWFDYRYVGFTVSLPVFDGLRKSYMIQQNRIQLQQINNQFTMLRKQINVEIYNAKTDLLNNLNNLKNQQENMELAEEIYNVSKLKYQEGVGSSLELTESDIAYKQAQSNYYNALLETLLAKVDYEKALGILIEK